jgi:O-antigen/teichoic acid export membrane protein
MRKGRAASLMVLAVAAQAAGNLLLHAVVGRRLPAADYGALGVLLATLTMLAVPLGALQPAASALAVRNGLGRRELRGTLRTTGIIGAAVAALLLPAAPLVAAFFRLPGPGSALLLAPFVLVAAPTAGVRGLLLGSRRVGLVAGTYLAGTAVRLGLGLALTGPLGMSGAMLGTVAGEAASLVVALAGLRLRGGTHPPGRSAHGSGLPLASIGRPALVVTGLFAFSTIDLLLAGHYLQGGACGAYVAAASVGKTVLAVPAALLGMVFPRLVAAWMRGGHGGHGGRVALRSAAVTVCGPAAVAGAAVLVDPALLLGLLYGSHYSSQQGLVRALAAIAAASSAVSLLSYAALARDSRYALLAWLAAAVEAAAIVAHHGDAAAVATGSAAGLCAALALLGGTELRAWVHRPATVPDGADAATGPDRTLLAA